MTISDIINIIKDSSEIGISFHSNPDGDALGSSLALLIGLRELNKKAYIISKDLVPDIYTFLPFANEVNNCTSDILQSTDCVIALDCGNIDRLSANIGLENKQYTIINIDHHISNDYYGDYNYVDTTAAAVGEIIFQLLSPLGIALTKDIATCLYTSILTDTGSFKHSNTTLNTHNIAGNLINTGIDFSEIYRKVYENKRLERVRLYGKVIDNIELLHDGSICIMYITQKMIDSINGDMSDTSDIISIGTSIDSVEVAVLIKETESGTKVSLRSKNKVDVRKIAETFSGGGHVRASGLALSLGAKEAKDVIVEAIEKELIK